MLSSRLSVCFQVFHNDTTTSNILFMRMSQIISVSVTTFIVLFFVSCIKLLPVPPSVGGNGGYDHGDTSVTTAPTDSSSNSTNCNPQHPCPVGYVCNNGHCQRSQETGCNCLHRPIPPGCGAACGPVTQDGKDRDTASVPVSAQ